MPINIRTNQFSEFLLKTQNTILSAAFILSITSGINAFLGFVKGRLLARYFGVSDVLAVFYTADRIPNLIYSVLIVGAVSTIFIPVFTDLLTKDKDKAYKTASSMMNATLFFFLVFGILMFFVSPQTITVLSIGKFNPSEVTLGSNLMRIMLLSQLILVGGSLITSVLQSFKYFLIPAFAPVAYNLGMIFGTIFLSSSIGIYGPAVGMVFGAFLYLLIQIPLLYSTRFSFSFSLNLKDTHLKEMFSLMPPRIISVLLANALATINNSLAILVSAPSVIFLKFGDQLQSFPVNLFGFSIAAAALPTLSSESGIETGDKFKKTFLTSFHQMMFLIMPASVILLILRVPVVRIVYGVANFPWEATIKTSYVLAFFSLSIFAQGANYLITRAFYALKDTKTPVKVSAVTVILNVLISLSLVTYWKMGVWAVALSYSITSILDMGILLYLLSRKVGGWSFEELIVPFIKISYAALLMGITLYLPVKLLDKVVFDTTRTINLLTLTGIAGFCGMATYLVFTKLFRVEEIELFYKLARKLNLAKVRVIEKPLIPPENAPVD